MGQLRRPILDYASIALTCRSLNRAATTMMYRDYNHCYDHNPSTRFISSLITNPALGSLVKEMKEVGHEGYNVTRSSYLMKPRARSFQSIQMIYSKIETLDIPEGEEYTALVRKGEDAFSALESALILYLTSNIEVVALNDCPEAGVEQRSQEIILPETSHDQRQPQAALLPIICAGRGISYGRVHQFTRLRRLSIQMKGLCINFLSHILQLDSPLEVILSRHYYHSSSINDPPCTWECPPKTSKVQKIRLDYFECHLELLENMLGSCQALTSLACDGIHEAPLVPRWLAIWRL
ncbi:hypothetical protein BKA58DRAFT_97731 [Alternaria rosae]|uniref:uncharacterized protein n=1 Tax=Alternaria rosae TaxID=1187941 RepID=UPI001E8D12D9|nr:uncharacterized protein BKA58DRAFT_97731 [Alternaria rosae]KAH6878556.1 hypothetical protein BKA58DRAFT_97731 [Alternaria rosae]